MSKDRYRSKAIQSFNTKLNIFLYDLARKNKLTAGFTNENFIQFSIDHKIIKDYTSAWQIRYKDEGGDEMKRIDQEIDDYYTNDTTKQQRLELQTDYISNRFTKIFPYEDFEVLLNQKKCHYCDLTEEQLHRLIAKKEIFKKQPNRGWSFEIDRKFPNDEYHKDNCVLCCYWCNNAKTDEFCEKEFEIIGDAIKVVWENRLNKL